jgi:transglutaminase-like putative cysteine protease
MTWDRYFKLSSYGVIASGFVAIAATGRVDAFSLIVFGSALAASWFIDTASLKRRIPSWLLNSLALVYLPFFLIDYRMLSRSFVVSTIHLIFFVSAVKLLTRSTDGDFVYLYCVSFAQLLAASILTVDITFLASLLVFLFAAVGTLMLFEMRRTHARMQKEGTLRPFVDPSASGDDGVGRLAGLPAWGLAGTTAAMTLMILVLAVPLFLLLPRIALGVYNRPIGRSRMTSGFSDRVELGEIGTIKESDAVVMHVRLANPGAGIPGNLKWRGIALDRYDGRSWMRSRPARVRISARGGFYQLENFIQGTQLLEQTFFLEALSTDVIFASHKVKAITSDVGMLQQDAGGSLFTARHDFQKMRYGATSEITPPDPDFIPALPGPYPSFVRDTCLQLPHLDERIAELAREVTREEEHPYRKAVALERYLRGNYGYSLELKGTPNSSDPIAMFLFDVRKGHCEYFASSMTIMLRELGIPARLVNGFRAGEYNRMADAFVVRQYDAHSWVEAYFEPYGWIEFDPTPADPIHVRSEIARMFNTFLDAVGLWWWEEVVNYDRYKQYRAIEAARTAISRFQRVLRDAVSTAYERLRVAWDRPVARNLSRRTVVVISGLSVLLAFLVYLRFSRNGSAFLRLQRSFYRLSRSPKPHRVITIYYKEALGLLDSHGMTRGSDLTPLEFAHSLRLHAVGPSLGDLTRLYNRVRFGSSADEGDLVRAEGLLQALRSALKRGNRA